MRFMGELQMRPRQQSNKLLSITRSKAKMYEYNVPEAQHIEIPRDPANLFCLSIGLLGDYTAKVNGEGANLEELDQLKDSLRFSAHFFDAYLNAKLNQSLSNILLLIGSASYYLCDFPGSSKVLAKRISGDIDCGCLGLEHLLVWLLKVNLSAPLEIPETPYTDMISRIAYEVLRYYRDGGDTETLYEFIGDLREQLYRRGTPEQLLFADIVSALVKKRIINSARYCLPRYTELPVDQWEAALQKPSFLNEFWPSQRLLGEHGIFKGKSAVVQMPTSAGKTRAIEIVIRSAFLSGRTSLAIIVAPFRALCHEIKNSLLMAFADEPISIDELSDILQKDFEIETFFEQKQVIIATPEKLIYMLRQTPELAENTGLLIYDEGHLFDSGLRGIIYELLITALKEVIPESTQTILMSAVIKNAAAVSTWLNGEDAEVISGTNLNPTDRTVAFSSWRTVRGRLEFVEPNDPDKWEFYVPRVIEQHNLELRGRETKQQVFPEQEDGKTVALYLGFKLVENGSIAVFCGRKDTAAGLCEKAVDVFSRGLSLRRPIEFSNIDEVNRLQCLYAHNLGDEAAATVSAGLGVFSHHGNTPHGIRLAVEYAMKEDLVKYVICTSTLAQGVNLPIRYLLVTSVYQGQDRISVRDFHNLIGRAGRSGIHTEGSIIFADPEVFDKRRSRTDGWRWAQARELLDPMNSEPCASSLLRFFDPLMSDHGNISSEMDSLDITRMYYEHAYDRRLVIENIEAQHNNRFTKAGIERQVSWRFDVIAALESYLMANCDDINENADSLPELAMQTLAYFLADDVKKAQIISLFNLIEENIEERIPELSKRKIFGKTLFGVRDTLYIESWVREHIDDIISTNNTDELLSVLWPVISGNIRNKLFRKCIPQEPLENFALSWIHGVPYHELRSTLMAQEVRVAYGTKPRKLKIENIVELCEQGLAYDGSLIIGAVTEVINQQDLEDSAQLVSNLELFQKQLKYGLCSTQSIAFYEMGFSDRVISKELSENISISSTKKRSLMRRLRLNSQLVRTIIEKYPAYYMNLAENLISNP